MNENLFLLEEHNLKSIAFLRMFENESIKKFKDFHPFILSLF